MIGLIKILFAFLVLILIGNSNTCLSDPVKIGAIFGVSGNVSRYGEWCIRGSELASQALTTEFRDKSTPIQLELQLEDSQGAPAKAISAYKKLKEISSVSFVVTAHSSVALAIAPLANRDKVVQMDVSATTSLYSTDKDYTFRTGVLVAPLVEKLVQELEQNTKLARTSVAILYIENDKGEAGYRTFKEKFKGKILLAESYLPTELDFKSILLRVASSGADTLFISGHLTDTALIVNQAKQLGIQITILTDVYSVEAPEFIEITKANSEGIIYSSPRLGKGKIADQFRADYYAKHKEQPTFLAAQAFDGVYSLGLAISSCYPISSTCVKDALYQLNLEGASGQISFNNFGDINRKEIELKVIKNGTFEPLTKGE